MRVCDPRTWAGCCWRGASQPFLAAHGQHEPRVDKAPTEPREATVDGVGPVWLDNIQQDVLRLPSDWLSRVNGILLSAERHLSAHVSLLACDTASHPDQPASFVVVASSSARIWELGTVCKAEPGSSLAAVLQRGEPVFSDNITSVQVAAAGAIPWGSSPAGIPAGGGGDGGIQNEHVSQQQQQHYADWVALHIAHDLTRFVAVPVMHGSAVVGMLLAAAAKTTPAPPCCATPAPSPPGLPTALSVPALRQLLFCVSVALCPGDGAARMRGLARLLRSLEEAPSLAALVRALCRGVEEHVWQALQLRAQAEAALLPDGPGGAFALLLLTHGSPEEEAAAAADSPPGSRRGQQVRAAGLLSAALDPVSGSRRRLYHPPLQWAAGPAPSPHRLALQAGGTCRPPQHDPNPNPQRSTVTGMVRPWHAAAPGAAEAYPPAAPPSSRGGPGLGPQRVLTLAGSPPARRAALVRYPSAPSRMLAAAPRSSTAMRVPGEAAGAGSSRPAVLQAQPILLSCTLLQQLLRQPPQPMPMPAPAPAQPHMPALNTGSDICLSLSDPSPPPPEPPPAAAPPSHYGMVIKDCQRHLHDTVAPSRDLLKLAVNGGAPRSLALFGIAVSTAGTGGGAAANVGGALQRTAAPPAQAAAAQHGLGPGCAGNGSSSSRSVFLALYLCFAAPVPEHLLESAVGICQELLTGPLLPLLERKLAGGLAAELAVLRAGVPGDYAVTLPPAAAATAAGHAVAAGAAAGQSPSPPFWSGSCLTPTAAVGGGGGGAVGIGSVGGIGIGSFPGRPGLHGGFGIGHSSSGAHRISSPRNYVLAGLSAVGSAVATALGGSRRSHADASVIPPSGIAAAAAACAAAGGGGSSTATAMHNGRTRNMDSNRNMVRMLLETDMLTLLEAPATAAAAAAGAGAARQLPGSSTEEALLMGTGSTIAATHHVSCGGAAFEQESGIGMEATNKSPLLVSTAQLHREDYLPCSARPMQQAVAPLRTPGATQAAASPLALAPAEAAVMAATMLSPAPAPGGACGLGGAARSDDLQLPPSAPGAATFPPPPPSCGPSPSPSLDLYRQAKGFICISDLEAAADMRAQLDVIVQGLRTSIHSAASAAASDAARLGSDADLPALRLTHVMGQGGTAIVFKGLLAGGAPVAVKVFEVPDVEATTHAHASLPLGLQLHRWRQRRQQRRRRELERIGDCARGEGGEGQEEEEEDELLEGAEEEAPVSEEEVMKRRRRLLRGAIEVAVLTAVSSPHVVQVLWYCPSAMLEETARCTCAAKHGRRRHHCPVHGHDHGLQGQQQQLPAGHTNGHNGPPDAAAVAAGSCRSNGSAAAAMGGECLFRLRRVADPAAFQYLGEGTSPLCTAVVMEWCDCGSLLDALEKAAFHDRPAGTATVNNNGTTGIIGPALATHQLGREPLPGPGPLAVAAASTERRLGPLNMRAALSTLLEVAMALRHLHALGIVHRDVKPANVLLRSNPTDPRGFSAKLADFGFALLLPGGPDSTHLPVSDDDVCGTVTHIPPESLLPGHVVHTFGDVFAFGILMWEMTSAGVRPYPQLPTRHIAREVVKGVRPVFDSSAPLAYRLLAQACWSAVPEDRPTAAELVVRLTEMLEAGL